MNDSIYQQYRNLALSNVIRRLKLSHGRLMKLVTDLGDEAFLTPGFFAWTGKLPLSSYVAPNTLSHYRWACKKIRHLQR